MRVRRGVRTVWIVPAFAAIAAACSDSTGPQTEFDAQATAASLESVLAAGESQEEALAGLQLAGEALAEYGSAGAALVPSGRGLAALLPAPGVREPVAAAVPLFPSDLVGKTLVYDGNRHQYVVDETATGAPPNGVRFIYYAIDPVTRRPAEPLVPLGHLDLTDESTASSTRLGVEVVSTSGDAPVTLIDYFIDLSYSTVPNGTAVHAAAEGYLSNDTERLDFDLSQTVTFTDNAESFTLDVDYGLELAEAGVAVSLTANATMTPGSEDPTEIEATLTIAQGGESVVVDLTLAADSSIEGTVRHNGEVAIEVGGSRSAPVFTRPDGEPVGPDEIEALRVLEGAFEAVIEFAARLFGVHDTAA